MLSYFSDELIDAELSRYPNGSYVDGIWTAGIAVISDIKIIVPQPITSNELQMLTDGEHVKNFRKTYCTDLLRTRNGDQDPDRIIYAGETYEVHQVDERNVLGNYYKVIMRKIDA